jgi:hypothetical protein
LVDEIVDGGGVGYDDGQPPFKFRGVEVIVRQ